MCLDIICINCRDDETCDGNEKLVMQSGCVGYSQGMPIPILYPSSRNPAFHSTCTVVPSVCQCARVSCGGRGGLAGEVEERNGGRCGVCIVCIH